VAPLVPRFLLPSLARVNQQAPSFAPVLGEPGPPWTPLALQPIDLAYLLERLAGVLRGLLLAGYDTPWIYLGVAGQAPDAWTEIDVASQQIEMFEPLFGEALESAWPASAQVALAIALEHRTDSAESDLTLDLPASAVGWAIANDVVTIYTTTAVTSAAMLVSALEAPIASLTSALVDTLLARWDQPDVAALSKAGLLWVFDSRNWLDPRASDEADEPLGFIGEAADLVMGTVHEGTIAPRDFLERQLTGQDGSLRELLAETPDGVSIWEGFYTEIYDRFRAAAETMSVPMAMADIPWLELILHLATEDILEIPELAGNEIDDLDDGVEPVDVREAPDRSSIEIRVWGDPGALVLRKGKAADLDRSVAWEYIDTAEDRMPRLVVVVGRGVELAEPSPPPQRWLPVIYRVQDLAHVPPRGEPIPVDLLDSSLSPGLLHLNGSDPAGFAQQLPNGVMLQLPANDTALGGSVCQMTIEVDIHSPDHQFTYDILNLSDHYPDPNEYYAIVAVVTPGVKVSVNNVFEGWTNYDWYVYEAPAGTTLPLPGGGVDIDLDQLARNVVEGSLPRDSPPPPPKMFGKDPRNPDVETSVPGAFMQWISMALDLGVGFVPIVGDAVDAWELINSFATGNDRWGRPVTNFDRLLMAGGTLLPFVSSSFVKGLGRKAANLVPSLLGGSVNSLEHAAEIPEGLLLRDARRVAEQARSFKHLPTETQELVVKWLARHAEQAGVDLAQIADGNKLVLSEILTTDGKDFIIPELQYYLNELRRTKPSLTARQSVDALTRIAGGRPKILLQALLGDDLSALSSAARRTKRVQVCPRWPSLVALVRKTTGLTADLLAVAARDPAAILAACTRSLPADVAAQQAARIEALLTKVAGGNLAALDETAMRKIVGRQELDLDDLVKAMSSSFDILSEEATFAGRTLDELLGVSGVETLVMDVVTRGGRENGSRFEAKLVGILLDDGVPASEILWQLVFSDGRKGPDFIRFLTGKAFIFQAKSYSRLAPLVYASKRAAIRKQLLRDLERLKAQQFLVGGLPVDKMITYYVDRARLEKYWLASMGDLDEELVTAIEVFTQDVNDWLKKINMKTPSGAFFQVLVELR
jgi:hypothetical protein